MLGKRQPMCEKARHSQVGLKWQKTIKKKTRLVSSSSFKYTIHHCSTNLVLFLSTLVRVKRSIKWARQVKDQKPKHTSGQQRQQHSLSVAPTPSSLETRRGERAGSPRERAWTLRRRQMSLSPTGRFIQVELHPRERSLLNTPLAPRRFSE